ncbi:hypothetical protein [Nostoc sp. KVJ3]|nr:hypothetical protein [Nostoc sp. KVJ3]
MGRHSDNSLQESRNNTILLASPTNAIPKDSRERSLVLGSLSRV